MERLEAETLSFGGGRRPRKWLRPVLLAAVLAGGVLGVVLLWPHPPPPPGAVAVGRAGWAVSLDHATDRATFTFQLRNTLGTPVTITQVGRSGPGLQLLRTRARLANSRDTSDQRGGSALPVSVGRRSGVAVTLTYHVSGCHGLHGRTWPIPVTYRVGSSGTRTVMRDPGGGPFELVWHSALVHGMCGR